MITGQEKRWNFFARELEEVLVGHRQSVSGLNPRLGVAEEKARRLQQSLFTPGSFPVLTPQELSQLALELDLEDAELFRLRAALLVTEVERALVSLLGPEQTWQVLRSIAPAITKALQERLLQESLLGAKRGPWWEALENTESDLIWEDIQTALNSATLALQLSDDIPDDRQRVKKLQAATADYQEALDLLHSLDEGSKRLSLWADTYQEAKGGFATTIERLDDLG